MNCSWCHKPVEDGCEADRTSLHQDCHDLMRLMGQNQDELDALEAKERASDPDCDPMASAEAQRLLAEYRRLNRLALNKLDTGNRMRLMFGQPLLD